MPSVKIVQNESNAIKLDKTPYASLIKMIPPVVNKTMVVDITDSCYPLVNAIRRTLISEMPMQHLTISLTDIHSTDPYIIGEVIKKRVEMIPISQSIHPDSIFSLRFENETDNVVDVLSDEIKLNGVSRSKDIMPMIPICNINSGTSFSLNDIHVVTSYGFDNARVSVGRIGYEILDQDFTQSSLLADPTHFQITIEISGIMDTIETMSSALKCLIDRLDSIDYSKSIVEFDTYKLTIINESHSIGQLIVWYINKLEPLIDYCAYRILHPSKRECIVDIRHPDAEKLCKTAVENIKKDINAIGKPFM